MTIVIVPRERFSFTRESLESVYANTSRDVALVYVDGGSPPATRRYLKEQAAERGFTLIRSDRFLSPNEARNAGLRWVRTPYVVFVDNDVIVAPHWLERLLDCALETGAAIVGPLCNIDIGGRVSVHLAGGDASIEEDAGRRICIETHRQADEPFAHGPALQRSACGHVEFHTMLVRMDLFAKTGPLDEGLRSLNEHVDLCLTARALGETVFYEPGSVVTYVAATRLRPSDVRFFIVRWGERWNTTTAAHFNAKWRLDPKHPRNGSAVRYGRFHRRRGLRLLSDAPKLSTLARAPRRALVVGERLFNLAYTAIVPT